MEHLDQLRNKTYLEILNSYLSSFHCSLIEKNETVPLDTLVMPIDANNFITATFIPNTEELFEEFQILQIHSILSGISYRGELDKVNEVFAKLNNQMPLGAFSFNDAGEVSWKYNLMVLNTEFWEKESMLDFFKGCKHCIEFFSKYILDCIEGERHFNQLLNKSK